MADRYMKQAFEADDLPSVLWVVQLDPRGASSVIHRCKQARPTEKGWVRWGWVRGG